MAQQTTSDWQPWCIALAWRGTGSSKRPLVPGVALQYFGYAILAVVIAVGTAEIALQYLATQRVVVSGDWVAENDAINRMNYQKVLSSPDDPVWRSAGIRPPPPAPGRKRLLVIGDSFVWGDGYLNANDIWWRQLQRELQHRGYFGVDVIAAGLNGASTQEQVRWIEAGGLLSVVRPDFMVLGYVTNDPDVQGADGKALVKQVGRDVLMPRWAAVDATLNRVLPTIAAHLKTKLTDKWASKLSDAYAYGEWERQILKSPNIDAYGDVVRSLHRAIETSGVPMFTVTLPSAPRAEVFGPLYEPIEPIFASVGVPFIDLMGNFVAEYPPNATTMGSNIVTWGVNPANGHPGPVATRFYARQVADILERDYPQVLGGKAPPEPLLVPRINDWMPPSARVTQTGPGRWRLSYPSPDALTPSLPLREPHVMVAFDLPVGIRKVRLSGERLKGASLWFTTADADSGVDSRDPVGGESIGGAKLEWTLAGSPGAALVNTLRIAADLGQQEPDQSIVLAPEQFSRWGGHAFSVPVPSLAGEADDDGHPARSEWVLLEGGVALKPGHAPHADIVSEGQGRWSHWKGTVIFSASDNSSPTRNHRRYQLVRYSSNQSQLDIDIEFDEPAVRP